MPAPTQKNELQRRYRELEAELAQVQSRLASLGPGQTLPGMYLTLELAGQRAALPSARVREIVRLVELTPLPGAPRHVLGTFLYRGEPVITVDLAAFLGRVAEPALDSHLVVLKASRPLALLVDRVVSLEEAPQVAEADPSDPGLQAWYASRIVGGLCRVGDRLLPLLDLEPLLQGV